MSLSVIDKYVIKKSKDLLDYAKILESIITIDDNNMWHNKKEFSYYAKDIISIYANSSYFLNNVHRDNPIEYSNDNINHVLKSVIEYAQRSKNVEMLKTWKNEVFLLSVIICTACYVDFATNIVDGNFKDTKSKFKYLLKYLGKTKILNIKENKKKIDMLFETIKKNSLEDKKFFEVIKSDSCFNEYVSIAPNYYLINYKYYIKELEGFNESIRSTVLKKYQNSFLMVSIEILEYDLLWKLISNEEVGYYLVNISKDLKRKNIMKLFSNKYFQENVKLLVSEKDIGKYRDVLKTYEEIKIGYVVLYEENEFSDNLKKYKDILVTKEFWDNNKERIEEIKDVNFQVKED